MGDDRSCETLSTVSDVIKITLYDKLAALKAFVLALILASIY